MNWSTLSIFERLNTYFDLAEGANLDFGPSLSNYLPTIIIFMHFNWLWARKKHSQSWEWKQGGASFYAQTSYLLTLHSYIFSRNVGIEKTFLTEGFNAIRLLIKTSTSLTLFSKKEEIMYFSINRIWEFRKENRVLVSTWKRTRLYLSKVF